MFPHGPPSVGQLSQKERDNERVPLAADAERRATLLFKVRCVLAGLSVIGITVTINIHSRIAIIITITVTMTMDDYNDDYSNDFNDDYSNDFNSNTE